MRTKFARKWSPIDKNILTLALYRIYASQKISKFKVACENNDPKYSFATVVFPMGLTIFIAVYRGMAKNAMWYE